jgi:hypothetical protein
MQPVAFKAAFLTPLPCKEGFTALPQNLIAIIYQYLAFQY